MNTKQKIGRACMIVGILLILGALALLGYNQWDANRADKASQDALGKLEETLTETMKWPEAIASMSFLVLPSPLTTAVRTVPAPGMSKPASFQPCMPRTAVKASGSGFSPVTR